MGRGYPLPMKQVAKATALVLAASLLSGCSSPEAKACEAAEKARATYNKKAAAMQAEANTIRDDLTKGFDVYMLDNKGKKNYKLSLQVIITYKNCFTPEQVVEAQQYLDNNK
jgi:hypothetical protein